MNKHLDRSAFESKCVAVHTEWESKNGLPLHYGWIWKTVNQERDGGNKMSGWQVDFILPPK